MVFTLKSCEIREQTKGSSSAPYQLVYSRVIYNEKLGEEQSFHRLPYHFSLIPTNSSFFRCAVFFGMPSGTVRYSVHPFFLSRAFPPPSLSIHVRTHKSRIKGMWENSPKQVKIQPLLYCSSFARSQGAGRVANKCATYV
ncbi:hypothetical protein L873DRAFT_30578 [Choiromyces venosus 120613-1]|uniref:Uncharacterized protein n=1 Tax=Choiromyces venosus 120613-1 TaxID=1336337 RepID=A0A3N4K6N5_9PEZI|nr:hypothetical protein L873DRAFT_30578 [Choiromyces venosus 120613-1]